MAYMSFPIQGGWPKVRGFKMMPFHGFASYGAVLAVGVNRNEWQE